MAGAADTNRAGGVLAPLGCWRLWPRRKSQSARTAPLSTDSCRAALATFPSVYGGAWLAGRQKERTRKNLAGLLARQSHQGRLLALLRRVPHVGVGRHSAMAVALWRGPDVAPCVAWRAVGTQQRDCPRFSLGSLLIPSRSPASWAGTRRGRKPKSRKAKNTRRAFVRDKYLFAYIYHARGPGLQLPGRGRGP